MSHKTKVTESSCALIGSKPGTDDLNFSTPESGRSSDSKKRKLHKTYIKGWSEDIAKNGFARCLIASCNFISSDVLTLQTHHKSCNGVFLTGEFSCDECKSCLASNEELLQHEAVCKGISKPVQKSSNTSSNNVNENITDDRSKNETETINREIGSSDESSNGGTKKLRFPSESISQVPNFNLFCCIHCRCGFPSKEEYLKHQEGCSSNMTSQTMKKTDSLHFRAIKQMRGDEHIIQPGPDFPTGQYRRRRSYRAEHKNSWALTLEKFKYVKCIYQNCYFIAMSLEDMIAHFGYCNGDGSFAKFVCPYCNGRVTSEHVLLKHIERSHSLESATTTTESVTEKNGDVSHSKNGRDVSVEINLRACENVCFDIKEFKCPRCQHRLPTEKEFASHVSSCNSPKNRVESEIANSQKKELEEVNLEIGPVVHQYKTKRPKTYFKSRNSIVASSNEKKIDNSNCRITKQMKNANPNDEHKTESDLPKERNIRKRVHTEENLKNWATTLRKLKCIKCSYPNCNLIVLTIQDMIAHFGRCNGDGNFAKFVCPYCNGRVISEQVLLKHIERTHSSESETTKTEPVINKNVDESHSGIKKDANSGVRQSSQTNRRGERTQSTCQKIWQKQIRDSGYGFCQKSLCNFMGPNIRELEVHSRTCNGVPDFQKFNCPKCKYRLPAEKEFSSHVASCNNAKYSPQSEITRRGKMVEVVDLEMGPVVHQYKTTCPKTYSKLPSTNSSPAAMTSLDDSSGQTPVETQQKPRGRGRKPKEKTEIREDGGKEGETTCGKCFLQCSKEEFVAHNIKKHFGLGWMGVEEPLDLNDEKLVVKLVKEAFKYTKKATCEKCGAVKRSVLGFVSHIQVCGKSDEEKDALKVPCPQCDGKYMKYSLGAHIKFTHSAAEEEKDEEGKEAKAELDPSGKRRSAIKAVTKFKQALTEKDEEEAGQETVYIFFEKGAEKLPKLNSKLNNLWYKLKRENKKIPCRHPNCAHLSEDVREAKTHHYSCPSLPEKVFLCDLCDYYSVDEPAIKAHAATHRRYSKQRKTGEEEAKLEEEAYENEEECNEEEEEEDEMEEEEEAGSSEEEGGDLDEGRKRKRRKGGESKSRKKAKLSTEPAKFDGDIEAKLRQNFCRREKIDNTRGIQFYSNGLNMTLEEDLATSQSQEEWPELHTRLSDWAPVPANQVSRHIPELEKSVSVRFGGGDTKWKKIGRFESDVIGGVPVAFAGGSVRSMSWSKVSFKRMLEKNQRQYLAVATANHVDHMSDIYKSGLGKGNILQIWDFGPLDNDLSTTPPKFALGIVQNGGEIWDLAWFPQDTFSEATGGRLTRLGLLAAGCQDGVVRVWSVCDPQELGTQEGLPIYKTEGVVRLFVEPGWDESCFQLSVGLDGIIAGGFANGTVAVWNLRNVSSPFSRKSENCHVIRAHLVFQAHKTAITALTFCPLNNRYISTAGLDRFVKLWDLECTSVPVEQSNKEYALENIWVLNWPAIIHNFDDVVVNFNKGVVKFIKDIFTDRHQSTLGMEDTCLSLSFSDWLNALCGGSVTGEVKLRLLKNLIHDQRRFQSTISSLRLERLNEEEGTKDFPRTYNEVFEKFGLVFKDSSGMDKKKPQKPQAHPEEFPIRAVNKIAFNPNFKCFTHIALGYNCGLIRIQPLRELQTTKVLKFFLEKSEKKKF